MICKIKIQTILSICCILLFCVSCQQNNESEKQKKLRKSIISHYTELDEPLKEKAANFLLDNLKDNYSISGEKFERYADTIINNFHLSDELLTVHNNLLPLKSLNLSEIKTMDVDTLTPEYLINNIDLAFKSWEKSAWKDQVDFSVFCEYVLPYRINNEPLENWRSEVLNDEYLKTLLDSVINEKEIYNTALHLVYEYSKNKTSMLFRFGKNSANIPDMPYSVLKKLKTGTCTNLLPEMIFVLRAIGIPATTDFTPLWGTRSLGHDWTVVLDTSNFKPFNYPIKRPKLAIKFTNDIPSKIYRRIFSINKESHAIKRGQCDFLPQLFNDSRIIDVTDIYTKTFNVEIPIKNNVLDEDFTYLAVSDRNTWTPVGWGEKKSDDQAHFNKVNTNIVYLPLMCIKQGGIAINDPFFITDSGNVTYIKPKKDSLINMELKRKYRMSDRTKKRINDTKGGEFQGSNTPDFKNPVTLHKISSPNPYKNSIDINEDIKFRYVRYVGKDSSQCKIAEIAFYNAENESKLTGKIIGTKGWFDHTKASNAFDGDLLTGFITKVSEKSPWVGLDLGEPKTINKIQFSSFNDQNHIVIGNTYELFYWDHKWISLGIQEATKNTLKYKDVPSECLYFLKNHTEGIEERVFTYENGEQVWR